jgi:hypothetical protein
MNALSVRIVKAGALATMVVAAALAQIAQDKPELCGRPEGVALPAGIGAWTDRSTGVSALTLSAGGGSRTIRLPGVQQEIREICPAGEDRVVVFGEHDGYSVYVVDVKRGTVVDSFLASSPTMSPDGHWVAFREFHPRQTEFTPSEQYLLYDLTGDAKTNRHGADAYTAEIAGWAVLPRGERGQPVNLLDVSAEARHEFRGRGFSWSANSRYFGFADQCGKDFRIVVAAAGSQPVARVSTLQPTEICGNGSTLLDQLRFSEGAGGPFPMIARLAGEGKCGESELTLTTESFRAESPVGVKPEKRKLPEGRSRPR